MAEENGSDVIKEVPVPEPDGALHDNDEIADAFLSIGDDAGGDADAGQEDDPSGNAAGESVSDDDTAEPVMPEGWDNALWVSAPAEVRAKIAEQVSAHAAAIAAEKKAQADLQAAQQAYTLKTNGQLQQALATMKHVIEGEFSQINWNALANSDPAAYVRLQRMYNERMGAVRQMEQNVAAQVEQYRQAQAVKEQQMLDSEYASVLPEVKALIGAGFNNRAYVTEIAQYLTSQGVPAEALNNITSGYELKLATKAMLYDRLIARKASAAKKVAEAPKVTSPSGSKAKAESDRFAKAMDILKKNPSSTDAIADVFLNL